MDIKFIEQVGATIVIVLYLFIAMLIGTQVANFLIGGSIPILGVFAYVGLIFAGLWACRTITTIWSNDT